MEVGDTYVFRVRAANSDGVGVASLASDPVTAKALPGITIRGLAICT